MGNHPSRKKEWQNTTIQPIDGGSKPKGDGEGGSVALVDSPPTWRVVLEDLTPAADEASGSMSR